MQNIKRFALLTLLALGTSLIAPPEADAKPFRRDITLNITFCWQSNTVDPACPSQPVELRADGSAYASTGAQSLTGTYTKRRGVLTITFDVPHPSLANTTYQVEYTGAKVRPGCWGGAMSSDLYSPPIPGVWEGCR